MNVQRLVDQLRTVSYHRAVSARALRQGEATELLPILHFALLDFSPHVASFTASHCGSLFAKDDASFTDAVFRLASHHLGVSAGLQPRQFLARGFTGARRVFLRAQQ